MAFELAKVTAHIAVLSITGVTVKDWGGVVDQADLRLCPLLQPDVTRQVEFQAIERNSFGDGAVAKQTLLYTVPYVLLYAPVGSERGLQKILPGMVEVMAAIVTALIENDTPSDAAVDLQLAAFTLGQTVSDPAGTAYHGVTLDVVVREFVN
jgi:hypothetical protein